MDSWGLWVIIGVLFAFGEVVTTGLYLAPFAASAFVAAALAALGAGEVIEPLVFAAVGIVLLLALRPIARSHRRMPPQIRTGTAALVGRHGLVLESIGGPEHTGSVKIDGEVWTARAYDEKDIAAGSQVHVVEIKGATALVSEE